MLSYAPVGVSNHTITNHNLNQPAGRIAFIPRIIK